MKNVLKVAALVLGLEAVAAAQTMLPNGSFEDGGLGCGIPDLPAPWEPIVITPYDTPDLYTFSCGLSPGGQDPAIYGNFPSLPFAHDGVRFVAGFGGDKFQIPESFKAPITLLVAGHTYVLSGWFTKSDKFVEAGGYGVRVFDTLPGPIESVGTLGTLTSIGSWTYDIIEFVAPMNASWIIFDPVPEYCYDGIDDLVLVELPFADLGSALAGSAGTPTLTALGTLVSNEPIEISLASARPASAVSLVVGLTQVFAPFKGGTMVPSPDVILSGFVSNDQGEVLISSLWPAGVPAGLDFYLQWWIQDPAGPKGLAASNGLQAHANGP